MMSPEIIAAIKAHAISEYPRECCGLVVKDDYTTRYIPCQNAHGSDDHFAIDREDYTAAEDSGEILAVVHSHPNYTSQPSHADRAGCENSGLPWFIVSVGVQSDGSIGCSQWTEVKPEGWGAPLIGRQFCHGVLDCYTLVRDWYKREANIELLDFDREDDWWYRGENLYVENYAKTGFKPVSGEPQRGDLLVMTVRAAVPNHGGIYLGTDATLQTEVSNVVGYGPFMLHHLYGRLSRIDIYGGPWLSKTQLVLRHRDMK